MASKDFFLSPDDSQTLGNVNYMRKSVRVRHTFPKNLKNPNGFEIIKEISSSEDKSVTSFNRTNSNNIAANSTPQPSLGRSIADRTASSQPRPQGSNMDMFRNMAREIGKK